MDKKVQKLSESDVRKGKESFKEGVVNVKLEIILE